MSKSSLNKISVNVFFVSGKYRFVVNTKINNIITAERMYQNLLIRIISRRYLTTTIKVVNVIVSKINIFNNISTSTKIPIEIVIKFTVS